MPTSVGDPAAGQRLNIPSLPKDAEIRINAGQYESRANPRSQSLGIIEIRSTRDLDRSATPLADQGWEAAGHLCDDQVRGGLGDGVDAGDVGR